MDPNKKNAIIISCIESRLWENTGGLQIFPGNKGNKQISIFLSFLCGFITSIFSRFKSEVLQKTIPLSSSIQTF